MSENITVGKNADKVLMSYAYSRAPHTDLSKKIDRFINENSEPLWKSSKPLYFIYVAYPQPENEIHVALSDGAGYFIKSQSEIYLDRVVDNSFKYSIWHDATGGLIWIPGFNTEKDRDIFIFRFMLSFSYFAPVFVNSLVDLCEWCDEVV